MRRLVAGPHARLARPRAMCTMDGPVLAVMAVVLVCAAIYLVKGFLAWSADPVPSTTEVILEQDTRPTPSLPVPATPHAD